MAPRPVHQIALDPPDQGASSDVPRLSRLQRLVWEVRDKIQSRYPKLPHGAGVVWENFPAMTEYAFGSRLALCTSRSHTPLGADQLVDGPSFLSRLNDRGVSG